MAIKTIIFDLGKVIVDFDFNEAYRRMGALSGLDREEMRSRLRVNNLVPDFECGRIEAAPFVAEVNSRLGMSLAISDFTDLWNSIFHRQPLISESLLEYLGRSHRLVLLSNTNTLHFEMIRDQFPHIAHFHSLVLSHEVGALKPDPSIYRAAVAQSGCAADECLFFDDILENVEGAHAAGLHAEQFLGLAKLHRDLERYGIALPSTEAA